jgi:Zn-dependent M16 (insulinase) family peptidase
MIPASQIERHPNGLQHHNINDEQGFSALIVVNTPALDDSGVSHAVEHLVFRRSTAFNHPESLFQLTALTDLSINASTHYNVTYYHCYSQCRKTCLLGLNYLLNGLLAPIFATEDLAQEIYRDDCYGVINRELTPQQANQQGNQQNNLQSIIARSDTSAQRCYQYGGDIELISQLTMADITRYHAQYYQAQKMHLVTGNIEPTLVASLLESIDDRTKNGTPYCPRVLPKADFCNNRQLVRWYIDEEFYAYFSTNHKSLSHLIEGLDALLISPQYNLNNKQQFTLDIIAPINVSKAILTKTLISFILKHTVHKSVKENKQSLKFSPVIILLFNYYQTLVRDLDTNFTKSRAKNLTKKPPQNLTEQVSFILGHGVVYPLQNPPHLKQQQKNTPIPLLPVANLLLKQLSQHLGENEHQQSEYKHRALPTLFSPLRIQAQQLLMQQKRVAEVFDADHCLIVIDIKNKEQNIAILASFIINAYPTFLASRTQGHCYAIVSQYVMDSHHLIFYSAFDVAPHFRLTAITESLKSLYKDLSFIAAALPLAKTKLNNVELKSITAGSIAEFILHNMPTSDT